MHLRTVPEDFDYNAQTGKRGDRGMRMEIKRSSVEYIASSEYMVRHTSSLYCQIFRSNEEL